MALAAARQFAWNIKEVNVIKGKRNMMKTFPKGSYCSTYELILKILKNLSAPFASQICAFPSLQCQRKFSCSLETAHGYTRNDYFSYIYMIPTSIIKTLREYHGFLDEAELDVMANDLLKKDVFEVHHKGKCSTLGCRSVSRSLKVLPDEDQFPSFLVVLDGANSHRDRTAGNNVYLPTSLSMSQNTRTIGGVVYLVDIDNLNKQEMKVLTSDPDVAERLIKDVTNTIYVCYKKGF
ncbi:hypothetical protein FB192DRAFT_1343639 [Mucor lusitanicus]|uniref:Uncharacterized protein n=2 Tax=Mucor circinelloides f. lusitanicus TaxID=29924 RepID=A0A168IHM6_MUCCL|nr:hypothetical protein FB192DRAFT_1343639 [Mucor lusitanicus]OAC99970.1 hypothetical protein MUCCIDRAFT_83652 [Mucor lusitanicus CBS 277.49]